MKHILFVYGTLMSGFGNNAFLQHDGIEFLGRAISEDLYCMTASGIPFVHSFLHKHKIHGEVYSVDDHEVMTAIDRLEGHPNWYTRTPLKVRMENGQVIEAEIYFNHNNDIDHELKMQYQEVVESGDYRQYIQNQPPRYFVFNGDDLDSETVS